MNTTKKAPKFKIVEASYDRETMLTLLTIQREVGIRLYPNEQLGITEKDIEELYDGALEELRRDEHFTTDPRYKLWLVKNDSETVGYCLLAGYTRYVDIEAIYLLPKYQRLGIGKQLMAMAIEWIGDNKTPFLTVASYNYDAIRFYQQLGFVRTEAILAPHIMVTPSGKLIPENNNDIRQRAVC